MKTWSRAVLAPLAVALALAGCGAAAGPTRGTASSRASLAGAPSASTPGCGPFPPRHAWALEVTASGRIAWRTPLATHGTDSIGSVAPVLAGPVAVLAQDGTVHGLRIADGRPLWAWRGGQAVYGMWRWGGLVAVLTDQVSSHARITGLDAVTGAVRWVLRGPGSCRRRAGHDPFRRGAADGQPRHRVGPVGAVRGQLARAGGGRPRGDD